VVLVLCLAVLVWRARRTQRQTPPPLTKRPSKVRRLLNSSSQDTSRSVSVSSFTHSAVELPGVSRMEGGGELYRTSSYSASGMSGVAVDDGRLEGVPVMYLAASSRLAGGAMMDRTSSASVLDVR